MTVESVDISTLTPDPANARKHPVRNVEAIKGSLTRFGQQKPIVVDGKGVVRAGNGTLVAAKALGWAKIDVVRSDLPLSELTAYAIADNRTGELAEWDDDILAALLKDETIGEVGFDDAEIKAFLADGDATGGGDVVEDEVPTSAPSRCSAGDLWQLGEHFLKCGDCREAPDVEELLGEARINVAVTSPPYASQRKYDEASGFKPIPPDEYVDWWEAVQVNVRAYLEPDGSFFVNIKPHCDGGERVLYVLDLVAAMKRRWGWKFVDEFCWRNTRDGVPGKWPNRLKNGWEPVYHFDNGNSQVRHSSVTHKSDAVFGYSPDNAKAGSGSGLLGAEKVGGYKQGNALPSNVIELAAESGSGEHSAPFPVGLPAFFIKAFSDPGDIIFDPFLGSGTTIIAAEQLGRWCYGLEISPKYCDIIIARWEKLTGKTAELCDVPETVSN